ncbi:hypothetical protein HDU83_004740 [Entophlyctis luteolus]|nr:hypothetical protein HDU82_003851 [Entophlyctis luteolus]KAJ3344809.1 hypothetical protein HDU83_004740 [Entophlyctis luteolus]KAJ3387970.1 hypothetical protein HDU84_000361 [Entophlyctis sp. JEL0112]
MTQPPDNYFIIKNYQMLVDLLLLALFSAIAASPLDLDKRSTCTVASYADFASCASSTSIAITGPFTVPANKVVDWSGLKSGTKITLTGTVTFAKGTLTTSDFLITVGGSGITFSGTGTLDGSGASYWDGKGSSGVAKPKMFKVKTTGGSKFSGFTIKNTPVHCFSISGSDTTFDGITINNSAGDAKNSAGTVLGHNTDGFDVSATGITIQNCNVHNQDDCLAVNKGSNINFLNNVCTGGHGISIGSVANGVTIDSVTVSGCTISNSANGVRIKTDYGNTSGSVSNIIYKDITLENITGYGIVVRQDYKDGSTVGTAVSKMPIKTVTLTNVHGTVASGAYSVFILCATGECTGFNWSEINVTTKKTSCTGVKPTGC